MCCRDCKKLGLSAFAAFIVLSALEFLIHEGLLRQVYAHPWYTALWNSPQAMNGRMPAMWLANAVFAAAFALIYTHGYEEDKGALGQGLRYGFWAGLLTGVHGALMSYFVYPVSCRLAAAWAVAGVAECLVLGAVVALIYRPAPHAH